MLDTVKKLVDDKIKELNMFVTDVYISEEYGQKTFNIELDSDEIIDMERITKASKIINPIMDDADLVEGSYILDIHSKEKGSVEDE
ncbi:MAG: hypothetical protein J6B89_01680 [Bacilli bacterium]|nr:hypothetical protein [Bacilli bacterium]